MSQACVERVIGVLATDESLRQRFAQDPRSVLEEMIGKGMELTECEQWSLSRLDPTVLTHFANMIDKRLQRASFEGGPS